MGANGVTVVEQEEAGVEGLWQHAACAVCGADRPRFLAHDWQTVAGRRYQFSLVRCGACGLAYINPRLNREMLTGSAGGGAWHEAAAVNAPLYRAGLRRLRQLLRTGSAEPALLDVGCGYGDFVAAVQAQGFTAAGVEIDAPAAEVAAGRGFTVYRDYLERLGLPAGSFDVVTLWDVIEHVGEPVSLLVEAARLLKPGGLLFFHTGNAAFQVNKGRLLARLRPGRGPYNAPVQHLCHYSPATGRALLERAGHFDYVEFTHLETLRYHRRSKYLAMKGYNESMRLLYRVGLPLLTSTLAAFARIAPVQS